MGSNSKIEWCQHTFNPWEGCTKVSPGCKNCYAENRAARFGRGWGPNEPRKMMAENYWRQPLRWDAWARDGICLACKGKGTIRLKPGSVVFGRTITGGELPCASCRATGRVDPYRARVFCASLSDLFEGKKTMPPASWEPVQKSRYRLFKTILNTEHLDWLLLTKRPENIVPWFQETRDSLIADYRGLDALSAGLVAGIASRYTSGACLPNVWFGTSVENQDAKVRIDLLRRVPAVVRFLSIEPLLEDLGELDLTGIHWVIVGGESGPNARPMCTQWVRNIRKQCLDAGVPFFFKQWGSHAPGRQFHTFTEWVNKAASNMNRGDALMDATGKLLHNGGEIKEAVFPLQVMHKADKKVAGRELDGREWNELPNNVQTVR